MKFICPRCNRISIDGNQWCQDKHCPAENALEIFDNGESFSNFEIIKLVTVLRSSAVYQAVRGKTTVYLKIAHQGHQERLKREARTLAQLSKSGQHPMLPVLLPAHEQASAEQYPYGRVVHKNKEKYYEVFAFCEGDTLRNLLLKSPQPWYQHAGWITISLADPLLMLHRSGKLHLGLNPGMVLIRFDKQDIPRPMLLDLGVAAEPGEVAKCWNNQTNEAAYTAPELVTKQGEFGPASDVYGLGLLLYEMLSGCPAYEYRLQKDEVIYQALQTREISRTGRTDLKNLPEITEKAVNRRYASRYPDVLSFARELQSNLPVIPKEKQGFKVNWRKVGVVIASAMAISLLLAFAIAVVGS